jgi:exosortase
VRVDIDKNCLVSKKLLTIALLTITAYIPTFIWMIGRWTAPNTYYSHGFLIPFISGFLVWLNREKICNTKPQPDGLGWVFFICGILIHIVSTLWQVSFTSGFSLLLVITGLVLLFLGKEHLRQLAFPVLFLIFMIPPPLVAVAQISFKLKILAARASTIIINSLGVPAIREGSIIKTPHSYLVVEDPCSGVSSLIAMVALGALMAYFLKGSKLRKVILFLSAVPIAIISNIARLIIISLVSELYGAKFAAGWFHYPMGVMVFVFSFFGLLLVGKLLE